MSFLNFRTTILCCAYWIFAYSVSINAQEITIDLTLAGGTGGNLNAFDGNVNLFTGTLNDDGISTSNVLTNPITVGVPEAGSSALELTIVNATATTGFDDFFGENRVFFNVSGVGLGLNGPEQRADPSIPAGTFPSSSVLSSPFHLDATHDQFLTLSFNQDVTVSAVVLTNLDPDETFQFGSATKITDLSDLTVPDLTLGTISEELSGLITTFTFETPLVIPADEEILVGQTGFDPAELNAANVGVGFRHIILTVGGASPLIGDVNMDGEIDFLDIPPFIARVISGVFLAEADANGDGDIDFLDIPGFIDLITGVA